MSRMVIKDLLNVEIIFITLISGVVFSLIYMLLIPVLISILIGCLTAIFIIVTSIIIINYPYYCRRKLQFDSLIKSWELMAKAESVEEINTIANNHKIYCECVQDHYKL